MDSIHYLEGVEVEVEVKKEAAEEVEGKWEALLGFL